MKSIWRDVHVRERVALKGDISTEVLVIGAGMAGVLTAYALSKAGLDCVVAEARRTGGGITGNTTAKITVGHGLIYAGLLKSSREKAAAYLAANKAALESYANLCKDIDCDFSYQTNYVYSLQDAAKIDKEARALCSLGEAAQVVREIPLPVNIAVAVALPSQAQFHPMKFLASVSEGLSIYENTPIERVEGGKAYSPKGTITAKHIVFACHFPFIDAHGAYFLKMYQHRSYVLALRGAQSLAGMYVDEAPLGMSFRAHGEYLFIGGGDHRTGKRGGGYDELLAFAGKHYPAAKAEYSWAAQDCMTLDALPYIGGYSATRGNWYVATGFNKWGMTGAMAAAKLICGKILKAEGGGIPKSALAGEDYGGIFQPNRSILRPQLAVNAFEAVANLITPTVPRCTHLGCALKWNAAEKSWDCPCHGSRFDENGGIMQNPAQRRLKKPRKP